MDVALRIEKVGRGNMRDFLQLIEGLARYEKATPPDAAARRRLEIDALSENPPYSAYVAYVEGRPAGYIIHYFTYSMYDGRRVFILEDIFVAENARKKGLGKELFKFCLEESKKTGCCELQWAVLTWNEDAIKFYRRMGDKRQDIHIYSIGEKDFDDVP